MIGHSPVDFRPFIKPNRRIATGNLALRLFFNYFTTHLTKIVTNEKKVYLTPGRQRCCLSACSYTPDDLDVVGHTYAGTTAARNDGKR